jgi:hypothetical protein
MKKTKKPLSLRTLACQKIKANECVISLLLNYGLFTGSLKCSDCNRMFTRSISDEVKGA